MNSRDLSVVIAPGQGTVRTVAGRVEHLSEFPEDSGVYARHMRWIADTVRELHPDLVVASGSRTRAATPELSEAESLVQVWASRSWPGIPIALDDLALDSGENLLLGLMTARLALDGALGTLMPPLNEADIAAAKASRLAPKAPRRRGARIGRVVILAAWRFKALRFSLAAEALGLQNYLVRGLAEACEAQASERAAWGEARCVAEIVNTGDALLLSTAWEQKRRNRFIGAGFERRLEGIREVFPHTFHALEALRAKSPARPPQMAELRQAFAKEVLA